MSSISEKVGNSMASRATAHRRAVHILLAAVVLIPPLVVIGGRFRGASYILYREPKLVLAQVLGWSLVVLLADSVRRQRDLRERVVRHLGQAWLLLFAAWSLWGCLSTLWAWSTPLAIYELMQNSLWISLLVLLPPWVQASEFSRRLVERAILVSALLMTMIGVWQYISPLGWLIPIDPQYGVSHPSLMGYKNPMALYLTAQIVLLAAVPFDRTRHTLERLAATVALPLEGWYLLTLLSRTSYVAVGAGLLLLTFLVALDGAYRRSRRLTVGLAAAPVLALAALLLVAPRLSRDHLPTDGSTEAIVHPVQRLRSAARLSTSPSTLADSDRGIYLRNTLEMVGSHPFGVGLGNWQAAYPVFRRVEPTRSFNREYQVRRAHSDPVQTLGELGWPGFLLWSGAWTALLLTCARQLLRRRQSERRLSALSRVVQIVTVLLAACFDYFWDLPAHRLLLLWLILLALPRGPSTRRGRRWLRHVDLRPMPWLVLPAAVAGVAWSLCLLPQAHRSARLQIIGSRVEQPPSTPMLPPSDMRSAIETGRSYLDLPISSKADFRSLDVLATVALAADLPELADRASRRALELAPYNPNTLTTRARVEFALGRPKSADSLLRMATAIDNATLGRPAPGPTQR